MKKVIFGALFLALVGIGVLACKKENVNPIQEKVQSTPNEFDVSTDGRMLIFESVEKFE